MFQPTEGQKIGIGLVGFGLFFLFLGVILLFDKGLLAIGNCLFLSGIAFIVGINRTWRFFFQREKLRASLFFFGGIFIVLLGWPIVGMLVELYGFFLLFKGFFPFVIEFLRRIPGVGLILSIPFISRFCDNLSGDTRRSIV
ncbi:Vesicle transport protein GOT1A [Orchesella cincta]|uniref:Vesicle transport protein GOT1A n=1 Tax=Orchesella cincta TaxID=48709 RepID=A0A1D2NH32_ORCCI|nr:Vesicle transport protein GOT1A [Orchesella cincta]